ncbi:hypothetical protein DFJ58DRAFT_888584 [Suillus subalutaceus]|uniref:uncharacterized protein n=1 Tax=Suillus subalutaceus TaxID=48586 RepID=UPI001B86EBCA|nr:uncharacterized protein DFJ58DRAFT_888584 [Suillus subalutaceus]KAG1849937.1 hypothetical protein DFJ58DRAFT_888584 [Suillus subalutaceus]
MQPSTIMVTFEEPLADLSSSDVERTSDTTLADMDLSGQEGQGCQQPAEGIQSPLARSCSRNGGEHQNDLTPLFRLPDEILVEIIKHGAETMIDRSGDSFEKTASHVSRRWRTIAISNPSLWTYISVCPEETPSFLLTRIHRSADIPIDVDIYPWPAMLTTFTRTVPQSLLAQLNIILRYASRLRSLTLRSGLVEPMFDFVLLYFTRYGRYLPSLESARLYGSKMQVKPWSRALFFDESCTPKLSTLEVANMKILSGINSCHSTITTLVLTNDIPSEIMITTFNDFMRVFASFPFLASLVTYGLVVDISSHQLFTDDHQYPALRTLGIHRIDGARFSSLIATLALIFPGITHLNLTGPRAASSLLEAIRQVSADQIWPGLQKLVLNTFIGHEWSQINHYLETHSGGNGEDRTQ